MYTEKVYSAGGRTWQAAFRMKSRPYGLGARSPPVAMETYVPVFYIPAHGKIAMTFPR
jgi:hypothetical protein